MKLPFVISAPHCSSRIPVKLRSGYSVTDEEIRESEDLGTAEIFGQLPAGTVLCAQWSRLVVDLNRSPDRRGPKGVVAEVDYDGRCIFCEGCFPREKEIQRRLKKYYHPFHEKLRHAIGKPGIKALFDCHSLYGTAPAEAPDRGESRKDITLGNNGDTAGKVNPGLGATTCPAETLHLMKEAFEERGFSVSINYPYSGGFITLNYGALLVKTGRVAVQIEINQDLYIEPLGKRFQPDRLGEVKTRILDTLEELAKTL